ncbi:endonuclease [Mycoplasma sp. 4013]
MKKFLLPFLTIASVATLIATSCNSQSNSTQEKTDKNSQKPSEISIPKESGGQKQQTPQNPMNKQQPKTENKIPKVQSESGNFSGNELDNFVSSHLDMVSLLKQDLLNEVATSDLKIVYDWKNKKIIKLNKDESLNWKNLGNRSLRNIFDVNIDKTYNMVNDKQPKQENNEKPNDYLRYTAENNQFKLFFKVAKISKGKVTLLSDNTFSIVFEVQKQTTQTVSTPVQIQPKQEINIQIPNPVNISNLKYKSDNYYQAANGKSGKALWEALSKLQKTHLNELKNKDSYKKLPEFYKDSKAFIDLYYEKDNSLLDIYSENPNGKDPYEYKSYQGGDSANTEGKGTNREHLIPQSWFNKNLPMRSDPNFVWPTDIKVNSERADFPHDNVKNVELTTENGSKLGTNILGQKVFEVIDTFKGDVARSYLYFITIYHDNGIYHKETNIFTQTFPNIKAHFLQTYLNWDTKDPVDAFDINRNNETYRVYGLRNPFIDYPNLFENLFSKNPKPFINKGILVSNGSSEILNS